MAQVPSKEPRNSAELESRGTQLVTPGAARELRSGRVAAATKAAYNKHLNYVREWYCSRYPESTALPLDRSPREPLAPDEVVQFIADHCQRLDALDRPLAPTLPQDLLEQLIRRGARRSRATPAIATVLARLSALAAAHRELRLPDPTRLPDVAEVLAGARRAAAVAGPRRQEKTALLADGLARCVAALDSGSARDLRDRALLLVAFAAGGRRRSEVAGLQMAHLDVVPRQRAAGVDYEWRLYRGKTFATNSDTEARRKPIAGEAADALTAWLALLSDWGVTSGPVFPRFRVRKAGPRGHRREVLTAEDRPIAGKTVAEIVARAAARAGLPGDWAGHSLRKGFGTEGLIRTGGNVAAVMAMTDHTNPATLLRHYYRPGQGLASPLAHLLQQQQQHQGSDDEPD